MKNSLAIVSEGKTKTLAERRELAQERTSFEILTNPPDKFSNGDVIGFAPYFTTQFGLPHSAVKGNIWQRHNGNDILSITTDCPYGLPSGSKPRLLLAWIATWQVRHPDLTVIDLGKNVSRFLERELGVPRTGRYIKDVQLEMIRLFSATISVITNDPETKQYSRDAALISKKFDLWRTKNDDQDALFPSYVILSEDFRQSILERPIPFDLRGLSILTPSSLAMDYYVWFARVMFSLRASRLVPWKALHDQFGSQYDWQDRRSRFDFRSESIKQITKRVHLAYPTLRVSFPQDKDGIMLHPSPTPVPHVPSKKIMLLRQS